MYAANLFSVQFRLEEEGVEKEHGYFKQIPGWDEPGLLCRLAFCHDGDPTCMLSWAVPVHADRPS